MTASPAIPSSSTSSTPLPSLPEVARLCLAAGRVMLQFGSSGRMVHEALKKIAFALGCDDCEVFCQHAGIMVTIHRGGESYFQMKKAGEHGVNLRRIEAVLEIIADLKAGRIDYLEAQIAFDRVPETTRAYHAWFVALATGLACASFGRLLGMDWAAFIPVLVGSSAGQYLRHTLVHARHNSFVVAGAASFVAAAIAGIGARIAGCEHLLVATIAAVLLAVPGIPIINAQVDVLESKPSLAAARALRILYILIFMGLGLLMAQLLVLPQSAFAAMAAFVPDKTWEHVLHQAFFGGVAAVGFSVLFNCAPRMLPLSFAGGVIALAVRTLAQNNGATLAVASFIAALTLAIAEKIWDGLPTPRGTVLAAVGSIPMVPGSLAARVLLAVFGYLRTGVALDANATATTWNTLIMLLFTLAGIGTGLALPSLIPASRPGEEH